MLKLSKSVYQDVEQIAATVSEPDLQASSETMQHQPDCQQSVVVGDADTDLVSVSIIGVHLVAQEPVDGAVQFKLEIDQDSTDVVETYIPACIIDDTKDDNTESVLGYLRRSGILAESSPLAPSQVSIEARHTASNTDISETVSSCAKVRKRKRNPEAHKKRKKRLLRNTGQQYVSRTGQVVEEQKLGPSCHCRKQCLDALTKPHCELLCSQFWKLGTFNSQNAYLFGQIKSYRPMHRRPESSGTKKQYSYARKICLAG